jgi:insertion element IS1 protein InsB
MQPYLPKCYNSVGGKMQCLHCNVVCIKHGTTNAGKQRYKCKSCGKTFIEGYSNNACRVPDSLISTLLKEGCGIRSMVRVLQISATTVLKRILLIAKGINKPAIVYNKTYEVDELRTYYKSKTKLLWVVYALQQDTWLVADFAVGNRTKTTLQKVTGTLFLSNACKIYTDKLNLYGFIIPPAIHCSRQYHINHIERKNLSLRTHLKRLSRRTICFSRSIAMLAACLKIYFWGQ